MLREINQTQKGKYCIDSVIYILYIEHIIYIWYRHIRIVKTDIV